MLRLLEMLRHLDSAVLSGGESSEVTTDKVWGALLAVVGGTVVLVAGLALASHAVLQLALVAVGMVLTVPYLQDVVDRARASVKE
jgi:hypothetical protein